MSWKLAVGFLPTFGPYSQKWVEQTSEVGRRKCGLIIQLVFFVCAKADKGNKYTGEHINDYYCYQG